MKQFLKNEDGAAAIEFALTAPLLIFVALTGMVIALATWQWNNLQSVAESTARCVALQSMLCEKVSAGCASSDAGVCYAVGQARAMSFDSGISESDIAINRNDTVGGVSVATVSIRQPFSLISSSYMLTAKASYPSGGGTTPSTGGQPQSPVDIHDAPAPL